MNFFKSSEESLVKFNDLKVIIKLIIKVQDSLLSNLMTLK